MDGHYRQPGRIEHQAIMLAEQRVRELHRLAAEQRLARLAATAEQPAQARWPRLPAWFRLPMRAAMRTAARPAQ